MTRSSSAPRRTRGRRRIRRGSAIGSVGLGIVVLVALTAVLAPWISPHDPSRQNLAAFLQPPVWISGNWQYVLGTDILGRDVLSRLIHGARVSLLVGVSAVAMAGTIGVLLGLTAGYLGGAVDALVMRLADIQLVLPTLVLAVALAAALGPGLATVVFVLGVTGWVRYARLLRGQTLAIRNQEYVEAARAVGSPTSRIVLRHLLPNVSTTIIVIASLEIASMIIAEASLSYLGLGLQPPTPSWGGMVAEGRDYLAAGWWVATFPGLAIVITVLGFNLFGDWLRDMLDPVSRKA